MRSLIRRIRLKLRRMTGRSEAPSLPTDLGLLLDRDWYLDYYHDVSDSGVDPLRHFLDNGLHELRDPNPLFDSQWYLATYPDVGQVGVPPILHYLANGAAELRDPSLLFSTREHLETYPWLIRAGLNPLAHRVLSGFIAPPPRTPPWLGPRGYGDSPVPKTTVDVVAETIRAFEAIEPDLAALEAHRLQDFPVISRLSPPCERAWAELYRTLTRSPKRVIFVPGLSEPDQAVLSLVRAVEDAGALAETLILSTDEIARPAPTWLPRDAQWRAYSDLGAWLDPTDRAFLTTTFLHSLRPSKAMLVGSRAAWDSLLTHGPALARLTTLSGWAPSGRRPEPSLRADLRTYFRTGLPFLHALYMEDERLAEDLAKRYGLPAGDHSKLITLRRPWFAEADESEDGASARPHSAHKRVLWVGDPGEAAEANLRNAFARFCADMELDLWRNYLSPVGAWDSDLDTIGDFDCVLLTTPPEGAVDLLLDAASAKIPVFHLGDGALSLGVKSSEIHVGSLFAGDGLEEPLAAFSAEVARRIRGLMGNKSASAAQAKRVRDWVSARHSPDEFVYILTRDGGFLDPADSHGERPR